MNVYTVGLSVMVYDAYISLNLNIKEAKKKKKIGLHLRIL